MSEEHEYTTPPKRRGIYLLPNLFTTAALFAGFYAVVQALDGQFQTAAVAIFAAIVLGDQHIRRRRTHGRAANRCDRSFRLRLQGDRRKQADQDHALPPAFSSPGNWPDHLT